MTLPSVIARYQKKVTVQQLKKVYVQLNQVLRYIKLDDVDLQLGKDPSYFVPNVVAKYYTNIIVYPANISHELAMCYDENTYIAGAGRAQYAILRSDGGGGGYISTPFMRHTRSIKLADGTCIGFNSFCDNSWVCNYVFVDINGSNRAPNILGRDLFFFTFDTKSETIKPLGWELGNPKCNQVTSDYNLRGSLCAAQIISDGWEIKKDYPWRGAW